VLRLWKGYRNAQVGWLISSGRHLPEVAPEGALLAVLYSPRRGAVEVWRARHGPLVASIPVGRRARLTYAPGGVTPAAPCPVCDGGATSATRAGQTPPQAAVRAVPACILLTRTLPAALADVLAAAQAGGDSAAIPEDVLHMLAVDI
jgi:hypothetical protein